MDKTYRIETVYTLKQPLSHIGESESTETFLNTVRVMNNGKPVEVFAYSGNAIRGAWRDAGAAYLLDKLGGIRVPKKTFHLLFTGGSISGDQKVDVGAAKNLRAVLPFISVFGGGVGNQILSGKIVQTFAFPVCAETAGNIPQGIDGIDYSAQAVSWRKMTDEISFSRKDDSKDTLGDMYIAKDVPLLEGDIDEKKKKDEPATQMRYTAEVMIPGVQLWHSLCITCSELELGALVASIWQWAQQPYLGGMSGKGFGLVDADFRILEDGEREPFMLVKDGKLGLAEPAKDAKDRYDAHLREIYDKYLEGNKEKLVKLLESGGAQ